MNLLNFHLEKLNKENHLNGEWVLRYIHADRFACKLSSLCILVLHSSVERPRISPHVNTELPSNTVWTSNFCDSINPFKIICICG